MKNLKKNLKSYKFWVSISASIVILVEILSKIFGFLIDRVVMISLLSAICMILIMLGVISDKDNTSSEEIADDIEDTLNKDDKQ